MSNTYSLGVFSATGSGGPVKNDGAQQTFQATLSNTTTPAATVQIQVSNDGNQWLTLGTITLSGANATDGFLASTSWDKVRANVTAISGTSATVTVTMGA